MESIAKNVTICDVPLVSKAPDSEERPQLEARAFPLRECWPRCRPHHRLRPAWARGGSVRSVGATTFQYLCGPQWMLGVNVKVCCSNVRVCPPDLLNWGEESPWVIEPFPSCQLWSWKRYRRCRKRLGVDTRSLAHSIDWTTSVAVPRVTVRCRSGHLGLFSDCPAMPETRQRPFSIRRISWFL